jgi:hypothetical protein
MQKNQQAIKLNEAHAYRGSVKMGIPTGGAHVRQVAIFIPELFPQKPTLSLTVYPVNGTGAMFVSYDVTVINNGSQTEIKVTAQNTVLDQAVPDLDVWLDFLVIG